MKRFRVGYAGITHMEFTPFRQIVAGDVAVAEGARQAEQLLARHRAAQDKAPESIAMVLGGTDNLKSEV